MELAIPQAVGPHYVAAACIPSNNLLSGPLKSPFDTLIGAMGGLIPILVLGGLVVVMIFAIITIRTDKASQHLKSAAMIAVVPLAVIIAILLFGVLYNALNNSC